MQVQARRFCVIAAVLLALATAIGALAVHVLKPRLSPDWYEVLQTAVHYQFFHSLGLLGVGVLLDRVAAPLLVIAGWALVAGIALFCGSLYLLTAGAPTVLGVLTPVGGISLIAGWCAAAWALRGEPARAP